MAVTIEALSELAIEGRTNAEIRKKTLEILKKFKSIHRKRNSTGQGSRANGQGIPTVYRYDDLVQVCGHRVVLPLATTLLTLGEDATTGGEGRDFEDRPTPPTPGTAPSSSAPQSSDTLPSALRPSTSGSSRPLSMTRPVRRVGLPTTLLQELRQLDANESLQNDQDRAISARNLEEKQADRSLRERELDARVKLRALIEKQLEFEIRKWERGSQ